MNNILNTPALTKHFKEGWKAGEFDTYTEGSLKEDWEQTITENCGVCNGTGFDPDVLKCPACDATGIDYEITFGVKDKHFYSKMTQNGLEAVFKYCEERRKLETPETIRKGLAAGLFALPSVVKFELVARGHDIDGLQADGNMRKIFPIIQSEYPKLLTTNMLRV